jgi:hypothetical protein
MFKLKEKEQPENLLQKLTYVVEEGTNVKSSLHAGPRNVIDSLIWSQTGLGCWTNAVSLSKSCALGLKRCMQNPDHC